MMASDAVYSIKPIKRVADELGIAAGELELYGETKAKVNLAIFQRLQDQPSGDLILVSAITPTAAGEGKTTTAIALAMGLNRIGQRAIVTLREPSLGPLFGMKGGATGAGRARVYPSDDINLHFTGDIHAVTAAHNLIAALVDNHILRRREPSIDPRQVTWGRVLDMNDRALRRVIIGLGGKGEGVPRETGFTITASSEVMAVLCLSEGYLDLKERLGQILIGFGYDGKAVYLKDLKVQGAAAALLKDALKPNLVQTIEGTPAFIHGGPFANIAQGTCSVLSMKLALKLAQFVVTEAGFGFDLGAEKFFDIVARKADLNPKVVVLVATVRALKMHGGVKKEGLNEPNATAVTGGLVNLEKHLENIAYFKVPAVVAINRFNTDTEEELKVITDYCRAKNIPHAIIDAYNKGGEGAQELAHIVATVARHDRHYQPLYDLETDVKTKIETVCRSIYGSKAVEYTPDAVKDLAIIAKLALEKLPVCIAKTQNSLSDNPDLLGRPRNFLITVRKINIATGAGFLVPITGDILLMPGLPVKPIAENVDIDAAGNISGLF